jgi:four helix bundle protein
LNQEFAMFRTLRLAVELARACDTVRARSDLKNQLVRASSSVALNLAEGAAKSSSRDQRKSYEIAFGSLKETQLILELCYAHADVADLADKTAAHLYRLIQSRR